MHPILFSLGPVTVYTFGFFAALGFLTATFVIWRQARDKQWNMETVLDTILVGTLGGLLGARAFYVALHPYEFEGNVTKVLLFLKYPGLSFLGGLVTGSIAALLWLRRHRVPWRAAADVLIFGVLVAHLIGSLGCFFNACMYGSITYVPWGVVVPGLLGRRHPVALYFVLADLLILLWLLRRFGQGIKPGVTTAWFFVLMLGSFVLIETWRGDSVYWLTFRAHQVLALGLGAVALGVLYKTTGHTPKGDWMAFVRKVKGVAAGEIRATLNPVAVASFFGKPWREITIAFRQWRMQSRWRRKRGKRYRV